MAAKGIQWRHLWVESVALSTTLTGRDKSARLCAYIARFLNGVTGRELFWTLARALSISRKTLRFYRPLQLLKLMEDAYHDSKLDHIDRTLTMFERGSDFVYCNIDHFTFLQRVGALDRWLTPRQADNLDRVLECFYFSEALAVMCREMRRFYLLRTQDGASGAAPSSPGPSTSQALKVSATPVDAAVPVVYVSRRIEKKRLNLLLLLKAFCDLPCSLYFVQPAATKDRRVHKAWVGLLGIVASIVSLYIQWPERIS
mmetsp:Transcript_50935/g.143363  ORF Transcript_50935/g.143363 Transcript_50935/m.143363 type:complete len:257 (+) Transcript_50935:61-831(+)